MAAHHAQHLPSVLHRRIRPIVFRFGIVLFPHQKQAWVPFVNRELAEGVGLVVLEQDIVARTVALDELLLQNQRLRFGVRDDQGDIMDQRDHDLDAEGVVCGRLEVGAHPLAEGLGLADVEDVAGNAPELVHPRSVRQVLEFFADGRIVPRCLSGFLNLFCQALLPFVEIRTRQDLRKIFLNH